MKGRDLKTVQYEARDTERQARQRLQFLREGEGDEFKKRLGILIISRVF